MNYQLSAEDRAVVEHVARSAQASSPEAVASAVTIHVRALTHAREDRRLLLLKLRDRERSIAMRELALSILQGEPDNG